MTTRYKDRAHHIKAHARRAASCCIQAFRSRALRCARGWSLCVSSNADIQATCTGFKLYAQQVGQAVDYKESDIWWHGVVWAKAPGSLSIYLPGQRL